jgi:hypothetical protein
MSFKILAEGVSQNPCNLGEKCGWLATLSPKAKQAHSFPVEYTMFTTFKRENSSRIA